MISFEILRGFLISLKLPNHLIHVHFFHIDYRVTPNKRDIAGRLISSARLCWLIPEFVDEPWYPSVIRIPYSLRIPTDSHDWSLYLLGFRGFSSHGDASCETGIR